MNSSSCSAAEVICYLITFASYLCLFFLPLIILYLLGPHDLLLSLFFFFFVCYHVPLRARCEEL
jgi:hypothetical protein